MSTGDLLLTSKNPPCLWLSRQTIYVKSELDQFNLLTFCQTAISRSWTIFSILSIRKKVPVSQNSISVTKFKFCNSIRLKKKQVLKNNVRESELVITFVVIKKQYTSRFDGTKCSEVEYQRWRFTFQRGSEGGDCWFNYNRQANKLRPATLKIQSNSRDVLLCCRSLSHFCPGSFFLSWYLTDAPFSSCLRILQLKFDLKHQRPSTENALCGAHCHYDRITCLLITSILH